MPFGIWGWVALAVIVVGAGGTIYYKIYESGKDSVRVEQERKLNTLKDKTNDAKTEALTAPDDFVDCELRKYADPNYKCRAVQ